MLIIYWERVDVKYNDIHEDSLQHCLCKGEHVVMATVTCSHGNSYSAACTVSASNSKEGFLIQQLNYFLVLITSYLKFLTFEAKIVLNYSISSVTHWLQQPDSI